MNTKIILLVSRNQEYATIISDRFSEVIGVKSVTLGNLQNLVENVVEQKASALLFDIPSISAGDALSALKRIRAFRHENESLQNDIRKIPIFILADKGDHGRSLFEEEQILVYFEKPYDPKKLNEKVLEALGL